MTGFTASYPQSPETLAVSAWQTGVPVLPGSLVTDLNMCTIKTLPISHPWRPRRENLIYDIPGSLFCWIHCFAVLLLGLMNFVCLAKLLLGKTWTTNNDFE